MSGPSDIALSLHGVTKRFGAVVALAGVDLEVRWGEVHALLGENGAGKSTLVKVLAGACAADAGEVRFEGAPYAPAGPLAALRRGVAMIYQELNLAPHLSVAENVTLGREPHRFGVIDRRAQRARAERALAELGTSRIDVRSRVGELSPADRQLVEIARALAAEARLLILDEPTSSLSHQDTEHLFDVVRRLRERGLAIIYISHFLEEIQRIADRYTVLRDGLAVSSGKVGTTPLDGLIESMVGRRLEEFFPRVVHTPGVVVLELRDLAGPALPRAASLTLRRGEILGIFGLVGAGRTELLRSVFALEPVRRGEVRLHGVAAPARSSAQRLGQGVGLLSEDRSGEGLALDRPVAENVTLSRLAPVSRAGWIRRGAQRRLTLHWVQRLGIRCDDPSQPARELSGGNQQKVALARLLHHDVDVLLLDEPTRGIDVGAKVEVYRLMGELAASGKALIVVSSYLPELLGVCDRLAVMHRGRLGEARSVEAWTEREVLSEATTGAA